MNPSQTEATHVFIANRDAVYQLLDFDAALIELIVAQLDALEERNQRAWTSAWKRVGEINEEDEYHLAPHLSIRKTVESLERIRSHGSLRLRYDVMVNQCVVLLVAHFGSACRSLFRAGVSRAVQERSSEAILRYEIRARAGELQSVDHSLNEFIAERLASEVSFQDMKSIGRAIKHYFDAELPRDRIVNDVILAQAARHVIVHSGLEADERFMKQIRDAVPRSLLPAISDGDRIQFSPDDVRAAGEAMFEYLLRIERLLQPTS